MKVKEYNRNFERDLVYIYNDFKIIIEHENKINIMKKDVSNKIKMITKKNKNEKDINELKDLKSMIVELFEKIKITKSQKSELKNLISKL